MREAFIELMVFGGKMFIAFIFVLFFISKYDLEVKKLGFNNHSPIFEIAKKCEEETFKSIARDIKEGNIENPSNETVVLDFLKNKIDNVNEILGNDLKTCPFLSVDSEREAALIDLVADEFSRNNRLEGYIFIGNFDNNEWGKPMFMEQVKMPRDIRKGDILTLTSNLYLRAEMPTNSDNYYYTIKSLKILLKGTKVTILDRPVSIKRKYTTQWWVHVSL